MGQLSACGLVNVSKLSQPTRHPIWFTDIGFPEGVETKKRQVDDNLRGARAHDGNCIFAVEQ